MFRSDLVCRRFMPAIASAVLMLAVLVAGDVAAATAGPTEVTGVTTVKRKDRFFTQEEWGNPLVLSRPGRITRVMDGTYGFTIIDSSGRKIADFLTPQQSIGFRLAAGEYHVEPAVCKIHRHHHVEVTVTED